MAVHIRVIGDVHGMIDREAERFGRTRNYLNLIAAARFSVQLGDFALIPFITEDGRVTLDKIQERVDPERHKIVLGNHDQYDLHLPHYLGDFGMHSFPLMEGSFDFFYVRGAWSIDQQRRIVGVSWWPEEELNWEQANAAVMAYQAAKPRTVFTHDCPTEIIYAMGKVPLYNFHPSKTHQYLQDMFERHKPEMWVFAHHHQNWAKYYKGTLFMCLSELAYLDFDENGHLLTDRPS